MSDPFSMPSRSDYLNALNATRYEGNPSLIPQGYVLLVTSDSLPQAADFAASGLQGAAYVNPQTGQIIIAYNGPQSVVSTNAVEQGAQSVDAQIARNDINLIARLEPQITTFESEVKNAADSLGYSFSKDNVFVTGQSEGGVFAQLSAQANGYAGESYGAPGIPGLLINNAESNGSQFTNIYYASDAIGNRGSDRAITPDNGVSAFHYGKDVMLGDEAQSQFTALAYQMTLSPDPGVAATGAAMLAEQTYFYHGINPYAAAYGIDLSKPQLAPSIDLDSMPDVTMLLRNLDATKGYISWDDNNVPTLTLYKTDGSTDTISTDVLSAGQYSFLYNQRLQNSQQQVAGVQVATNDDGTQTVSSQESTYDFSGILQSQLDVSAAGNRLLKEYNPDNGKIAQELDVDEDDEGNITAAQAILSSPVVAAGGSIGEIFGSAIGRAIAGNNQFAQLAAGTVVGAIGKEFGQVVSSALSTDLADVPVDQIFGGFGVNVSGAALGSIASFLTAELGTALGLNGYGAQLFDAAVGSYAGSVLNQVLQMSLNPAITAIDWSAAFNQAGAGIGTALGSIIAHELVPAQTHIGAVSGQILGGGPLPKRAHQNLHYSGLITPSSDLQTDEDYECYLDNRTLIELTAAEWRGGASTHHRIGRAVWR